MLSLLIICAFSVSMISAVSADEISRLLESKKPIRVFVKGFANESGQGNVSVEDFKKTVEVSLRNRKSVIFQLVKNVEESQIQIAGIIKQCQYLKRGPFKPSPSIAGLLLDAAATATENYADMVAEFTIIDSKTGDTLWKRDIGVYIKKLMSQAESIPLIYDKTARAFIWRSFGKLRKL